MMATAMAPDTAEVSDFGLRRRAQQRLRQVIELLEGDDSGEIGQAFALIGEVESMIDALLQRTEVDDG